MSGGWTGNDRPGIQKWYTIKRDAQREEREDSGWRGEARKGRERTEGEEGGGGNLWQRVDRKRSAEKCTTSGSGLAALRAHHRVRVRQKERKRTRARERERRRERGREKGTDGSGRETDVYPPTNTDARGGGREESQAESRWARSGLPEFHTHRVLLRVSSRRVELREGGGATPTRKEGRREFPRESRVTSQKRSRFFEKRNRRSPSSPPNNGSTLIGAQECNCS